MNSLYSYDNSDDDCSPDPSKRRRLDKESSKSKKKHKKHKKNKKSSKHDSDSKEKSKKHKKHKRKYRSGDEIHANSDTEIVVRKHKNEVQKIVNTVSEPQAGKSVTTLNNKFTEIMKSNGHVVVAKTPTTKILPTLGNGNGNGSNGGVAIAPTASSKKHSKVSTDPNKLVELITKTLDLHVPSMEIVSSESDSDTVYDVDSPDIAVIEDELNLEELMKQKALLQARLGVFVASDTEGDVTPTEKPTETTRSKPLDAGKKDLTVSNLQKQRTVASEVILLDDSSNDGQLRQSPAKRRIRTSRSKSKDRPVKENRQETPRDRAIKQRRSENDNRFKEDLRKEIDRDKERSFRDNQNQRLSGNNRYENERRPERAVRDRSRFSMERENRRVSGRNSRERDRDRVNDRDRERERDRDRDRYDNRKRDDRYKRNEDGFRKRKVDKYMGSLSEGQKVDEKGSSSDSEIADIKMDDDDDEEKIIEQRRKKREELLKVFIVFVCTTKMIST